MGFFYPLRGLIGAWARLLSDSGDTITFPSFRVQRTSKGSRLCGNGPMSFTSLLICYFVDDVGSRPSFAGLGEGPGLEELPTRKCQEKTVTSFDRLM